MTTTQPTMIPMTAPMGRPPLACDVPETVLKHVLSVVSVAADRKKPTGCLPFLLDCQREVHAAMLLWV